MSARDYRLVTFLNTPEPPHPASGVVMLVKPSLGRHFTELTAAWSLVANYLRYLSNCSFRRARDSLGEENRCEIGRFASSTGISQSCFANWTTNSLQYTNRALSGVHSAPNSSAGSWFLANRCGYRIRFNSCRSIAFIQFNGVSGSREVE